MVAIPLTTTGALAGLQTLLVLLVLLSFGYLASSLLELLTLLVGLSFEFLFLDAGLPLVLFFNKADFLDLS